MQQRQQDDGTVNAAAIILAAAARATTNTGHLRLRHQELDHASCAATKKTRWWSRLKAKLACFRPHGHPRRIVDASLEPAAASSSTSSYYHTGHAPPPALAFVAPPPSPASSTLTWGSSSPAALPNASVSSYSSPTASIFAVGPYAREPQQLVSPPAFSAGLTEPSTAPLTPPSELTACSCSPHLVATTPSSPEVPFARFVRPSIPAAESLFNAYQLQPGSPILVSPGSTSSSPPSWTMQRPVRTRHEVLSLLDGGRIPITHEDEMGKSGGDFVFGNNADAADCGSLPLGGATEQWPFHLAHG